MPIPRKKKSEDSMDRITAEWLDAIKTRISLAKKVSKTIEAALKKHTTEDEEICVRFDELEERAANLEDYVPSITELSDELKVECVELVDSFIEELEGDLESAKEFWADDRSEDDSDEDGDEEDNDNEDEDGRPLEDDDDD